MSQVGTHPDMTLEVARTTTNNNKQINKPQNSHRDRNKKNLVFPLVFEKQTVVSTNFHKSDFCCILSDANSIVTLVTDLWDGGKGHPGTIGEAR